MKMMNISMHWSACLLFGMALSMTILDLFSTADSKTLVAKQSFQKVHSVSPYTVILLQKSQPEEKVPRLAAVIDHFEPSLAEKIIKMHIENQTKMEKEAYESLDDIVINNTAIDIQELKKDYNQNRTIVHSSRRTSISPSEWELHRGDGIISTSFVVLSAFMSLVFGALSAGRIIRKKPIFKAYFETESIQDDVAWDSALTTVMSEVDYGSFYARSDTWAGGDLEKFDV